MPVVLEPDDSSAPADKTEVSSGALMLSVLDDVIHFWPVSRAGNSMHNNGAELLDRIDDPHAPPPSGVPSGNSPT